MRVLFQGGRIVDGTGDPAFEGDVWTEDDRILRVLTQEEAEAVAPPAFDRVVDCSGLAVAPGFIDAHSHNDFYADHPDSGRFYVPFLEQGITTQVTGNCGFSPFGADPASPHKELIGGGLFTARQPGSFADFCDRAGELWVNMVPLVGQGTARISVSGFSAKPLDAAGLETELGLAREALEGGAFGGSLGLMYEPGMYAPMSELRAFAETVAKFDGILTVHPRANSQTSNGYSLLRRGHLYLGFEEVAWLMRETGVRAEYSHLIFVGRRSWKSLEPMLERFYDCQRQGLDLGYDLYSYPYGASVITVLLAPDYLKKSPEQRRAFFTALKTKVLMKLTPKVLGIGYGDILVAYVDEAGQKFEGLTLPQIAEKTGKKEAEVYLELVERSQGRGRIFLGKYYNDEMIARLMEDELSVFMTDAWVEERGVQNASAYQAFPRFLEIGRERGMPLETLIHKMTGKTAARFRIPGRGTLKAGNFADLTVFDPGAVGTLPEPDARPEGIRLVMVNGRVAVENGQSTGLRAGRLLRKGHST